MTEGKDSWETVAVSTNDNDEDARAQHQRALLHNAPKAPPREPKPGEQLMTFEHGQDVYRVELRDFQPNGVETQIFQNGELLAACRFAARRTIQEEFRHQQPSQFAPQTGGAFGARAGGFTAAEAAAIYDLVNDL